MWVLVEILIKFDIVFVKFWSFCLCMYVIVMVLCLHVGFTVFRADELGFID